MKSKLTIAFIFIFFILGSSCSSTSNSVNVLLDYESRAPSIPSQLELEALVDIPFESLEKKSKSEDQEIDLYFLDNKYFNG